jgi:hypothetical protein
MANSPRTMPYTVVWNPAWVIMLMTGLFTMGIIAKETNMSYEKSKQRNGEILFKNELFMHVAGQKKAGDFVLPIAKYLMDNKDRLDELLQDEKIIRTTSQDARVALHFSNPKKVTQELLTLAEDSRWQKLRSNKEDLNTLRLLLNGTKKNVPKVVYADANDGIPTWGWWLIILVAQLAGTGTFFFKFMLQYEVENYYWYDLSVQTRMSMILMLPGGLPLFAPAILVSAKRCARAKIKNNAVVVKKGNMDHQRGLGYRHSSGNSERSLEKLKQRTKVDTHTKKESI